MRRFLLLITLVLVVATSATGVRASTDCERWFAAYKAELAHTQAVKKLAAARARAKKYAKRKLANYVHKPAGPKLIRTHYPRYTPQQIRDRFKLLCGDLPEDAPVEKLLSGRMSPGEFASEQEPFVPVEMANDGPGPIVPGTGPGDGGSGGNTPETPGGPGGGPIFGGGGGGAPGTPGSPGLPSTPGTPDTPTPPVTPVPEPGSIVLVLTGAAGALGAVRRRMKA